MAFKHRICLILLMLSLTCATLLKAQVQTEVPPVVTPAISWENFGKTGI